nr:hypothetical protein [Polymorphobacter sp.]
MHNRIPTIALVAATGLALAACGQKRTDAPPAPAVVVETTPAGTMVDDTKNSEPPTATGVVDDTKNSEPPTVGAAMVDDTKNSEPPTATGVVVDDSK